jgi:hypothetical protein
VVIAQLLFHGHGYQVGIGTDQLVLFGMTAQGVEHLAQQVGGRLVSSDQQMNCDEEQLFVGEAAVGVVLEQPTQDGARLLQPIHGPEHRPTADVACFLTRTTRRSFINGANPSRRRRMVRSLSPSPRH